jgi:hypothetical protein
LFTAELTASSVAPATMLVAQLPVIAFAMVHQLLL